ncbi:calcium/sodium antiporter [Fusibacter ferrireducens]|uniref:Calcium/sodium antiporter n=1 Tax=Fusibacter ferrireducens TaxID=2785058 RepID=A0ABR9ZVY6_9FIRM|nr:calcium/sodium antiporter [Fusibacter ferrireducens]MBF4694595.1 calcium/sodium antiporter [Fusibacter ferrireducens]
MENWFSTVLLSLATPLIFIIAAVSLYTLGKGADILVDESVGISKKLGIPKAIIGATIVSLGTTLPEASVSVMAALKGNPDLALGNAVGSIIVDTGLIIGIASIIQPIIVDYKAIKIQSWIQILSGFLLVFLSLPFVSGGTIHQWMGILLVILLITYLFWSLKHSKKNMLNVDEPDLPEDPLEHPSAEAQNPVLQLLLLIFGIALIIVSSKVLIPSVEIIATRIGIPQSIIAATMVAFGTSLPELTTAIKAVRKGHGDLAIGNIIGADILNVLFVVGASASFTSKGLHVPNSFFSLQYPALIIILSLFRFMTLSRERKITRFKGSLLLIAYCIYLGLNYLI